MVECISMKQISIPTRREYIERQRREKDWRIFGVFPAFVPKELFWASHVLPVEIWDPPLTTTESNAHLQPYICSVVKLGMEALLQGYGRDLDGLLFPHTCDSIQNMASMVHDFMDLSLPCHFFYHPKAPYTEASKWFLRGHLQDLATGLMGGDDSENRGSEMSPEILRPWVDQGREIHALLAELYAIRASGRLNVSNACFYEKVRMGEYLLPEDYQGVLSSLLENDRGAKHDGPVVFLSGILPSPREILVLLDDLGVRVGDDDLLACGRRFKVQTPVGENPWDALVEGYFSMPPCSTRGSLVQDRADYLLEAVERCGAVGVIFLMVKFCEPELFDVPQLTRILKDAGLSTLVLDCEVNQALSGQLATRIEAFVETMRSR